VTLHERLRQAIELLPPEAALSLPVRVMRELLDSAAHSNPSPGDDGHDLTVAEVAARLARPCSTVRAWVAAGRFAGSYKLSERDWRVPVASLVAFLDGRQPAAPTASDGPHVRRRTHRAAGGDVDLSAWRNPA
jgi:hypothetical protein